MVRQYETDHARAVYDGIDAKERPTKLEDNARGGEVDLVTRQLLVYGWTSESKKDRKRCIE
eukprot:5523912-Alexandrium_andersonii.AAC.1